ncbi:hypothetical protein [Brevundimonas sp. UBA2416]|uniref:hypothetical protein n=1 Tax=Brevundimonas sp. UBA2416 TaxID=1946124 RepID=UPI0025B91E9A|nr:hypothetical protein [Brevundimonas sp. UBA2416]HRJ64583.1 hypothetical protein [Brevundimonas sp.]
MIALFVIAALAAQSPPPEPAWTWTLYADAEPVVLAHEVPDTANLRTTLECDPGTSVARLTLYGGVVLSGMARVTSGEASAVAEATPARAGSTRLALRTDHPVFAAFTVDGQMAVVVGDQRRPVEIPAAHLAKLRRFAELCSG